MSLLVLTNISSTAKRRGVVCLVLFVLSLFLSFMTTMTASSVTTMDHAMSQMQSDAHNMSPHCNSTVQDHCEMSSEHDHQNCIDSHCSSFSTLLVSYVSNLDKINLVQTILTSKPYVSTHLNTPYTPPIVLS